MAANQRSSIQYSSFKNICILIFPKLNQFLSFLYSWIISTLQLHYRTLIARNLSSGIQNNYVYLIFFIAKMFLCYILDGIKLFFFYFILFLHALNLQFLHRTCIWSQLRIVYTIICIQKYLCSTWTKLFESFDKQFGGCTKQYAVL